MRFFESDVVNWYSFCCF